MGGHVFLCYSHSGDTAYVESLAAHLTGAGVPVWFDKEIITGDRWESMIRTKIDTCAAVIVVMTREAESSDWVTREIHRAETRAKPIFPLLLRDEVFFRLSNIQYEDVTCRQMPGTAFVARLRRLSRLAVAVGAAPHPIDPPLRNALDRINEANEMLMRLIDSSPGSRSAAGPPQSASASPATSPLILDFALTEISRLVGYVRLLGQLDDLVYDGEDRDWLLGLTRSTRISLDATSVTSIDNRGRGVVDGDLWVSDLGRQYLDAQRHAVARGVKIRRTFIVDTPELLKAADFIDVLRQHAAIGIEVKTLHPNRSASLRRASLFDFIIFDRVLSYHISLTRTRANRSQLDVVSTTLITDPARVADRMAQYEDLWRAASTFTPG